MSEKALYDPCVLISGLPKSLIRELTFRNGAPESVTKIVRRFGSTVSKFHNVIIRSSVGFRESALRSGRVFLGASSFRVEDYINVLKCFRCQRYGHVAKNCVHEIACGLCSEAHITRDCPEKDTDTFKCINCIRGNKITVCHSTNSKKCPFFINAVINQTEATNYGATC